MQNEYLVAKKEDAEFIKNHLPTGVEYNATSLHGVQMVALTTKNNDENAAFELGVLNELFTIRSNITTLSNGSAEHLNKSLFPLFNEFERKLRKLLYLGALRSHKEKTKGIENINDLENKDLGQLFTILFTDSDFNCNVREMHKKVTWQYSKKWILERIETYEENTLWNALFGSRLPKLIDGHLAVKDARNDVMHAHDIYPRKYKAIKKMIRELNGDIDDLITDIVSPKPEVPIVSDYNSLMFEALTQYNENTKNLFANINEKYQEVFSTLAPSFIELQNYLSDNTRSLDLTNIAFSLEQMAHIASGTIEKTKKENTTNEKDEKVSSQMQDENPEDKKNN